MLNRQSIQLERAIKVKCVHSILCVESRMLHRQEYNQVT